LAPAAVRVIVHAASAAIGKAATSEVFCLVTGLSASGGAPVLDL